MTPLRQPAPPSGQPSLEKRIAAERGRHPRPAGRGRGRQAARRAFGRLPQVDRLEAAEAWSVFLRETVGTREDCAAVFGVTFWAACKWFDALSCPGGDKVLRAAVLFPAAFARLTARVAA